MRRILEWAAVTYNIKWLPFIYNFDFFLMEEIADMAKTGQPSVQPEGTLNKNRLDFRDLVFIPAQLSRFPLERTDPVDTSVIIGKEAKMPLKLSIPLMVTGMGYGVSVSMKAKLALAKGATLANTAICSGESGYVQEERDNCKQYIIQYNKAKFGNRPEELKNCDMIEIRVGQGSKGADGFVVLHDMMDDRLRKQLGVKPGQDAVMPNRFPELKAPGDLKRMVDDLRDLTGGVPIAVKVGVGDIEGDLKIAVDAGVDAIVIDGGGGTAGTIEDLTDTIGLPLVYGISKAHKLLKGLGVRDKTSLIVTGGTHRPGDFLKAIALGADAVYLGQNALLAMVYHQAYKMKAGRNPVEMFVYRGAEVDTLDVEQGARDLANFINASVEVMRTTARVLGKSALRDVNTDDLRTLTELASKVTGVKAAY